MTNADEVIAKIGTVELVPLPKSIRVGRNVVSRVHGTDRPATVVAIEGTGDLLTLEYQVGSNTYRATVPKSDVFDLKISRNGDSSETPKKKGRLPKGDGPDSLKELLRF